MNNLITENRVITISKKKQKTIFISAFVIQFHSKTTKEKSGGGNDEIRWNHIYIFKK